MVSTRCSSTLMLVLFLLVPHSLGDTQSLINQICRQTDDFNFCRTVFNQRLVNPNTDIKGLTQIALTQTLAISGNTLKFIRKLEAAEKDKEIIGLLKDCEASYGVLLTRFQQANLAFAKGDYKSVSSLVDKCDRLVIDCQSALGSMVPQLNKQNPQNRVLIKMSLVSDQLIGF